MKKAELVQFMKDEHKRIEDVLYQLGEIKDVKVDSETTNDIIQQAFVFVENQIERGNHDKALSALKKHKWSTRKWI